MTSAPATNAAGSPLPHTLRFRRWGNTAGLLLLAGYLIFCHGCHGEDVDDELAIPPRFRSRPPAAQTVPAAPAWSGQAAPGDRQ